MFGVRSGSSESCSGWPLKESEMGAALIRLQPTFFKVATLPRVKIRVERD